MGYNYPNDPNIIDLHATGQQESGTFLLVIGSGAWSKLTVPQLRAYLGGGRILGEVALYPFEIAPSLWVFCRGGNILRTTLLGQALVSAGAPFGVGDGSTTVSLPNWEFRTPYGADGVVYMPGDEVVETNYKDNTLLQHHHSLLWPGVLQIRGLESGGVVHNVLSGVIPSESIDTTNTGEEDATYQVLQRDFGIYYIMFAGEDVEVS